MFSDRFWMCGSVMLIFCAVFPSAVLAETAVFQLESPTWGQISPPEIWLPMDLGVGPVSVSDVRVSYSGVAHVGTGTFTTGDPYWDTYTMPCSSEMRAVFVDGGQVRSHVQFEGDGIPYTGTFFFQNWDCTSDDPGDCSVSSSPEVDWSFFDDGRSALQLFDDDWHQLGTKCSAFFDIELLTVEIDYTLATPTATSTWGAVKSIYR